MNLVGFGFFNMLGAVCMYYTTKIQEILSRITTYSLNIHFAIVLSEAGIVVIILK